jgi:hypothetical protein
LAVGWRLTRAENQQLRNDYGRLKASSDAMNKFNTESMDKLQRALDASTLMAERYQRQLGLLELLNDRKKTGVSNMPILAPPEMTHAPTR